MKSLLIVINGKWSIKFFESYENKIFHKKPKCNVVYYYSNEFYNFYDKYEIRK